MELSKRLRCAASLVTAGNRAADVGTDHGYLPIWLVEQGVCPRAIAMDVRPGPLERAQVHIREHGLEGKIETRLGDGLQPLAPGEADTLILTGMGGPLMRRILTEGEAAARAARELILSPQSDLRAFRRFLYENGYTVTAERMLREDGKYYTVMRAIPGPDPEPWAEADFAYGRQLLRQRPPVLREFLEKKREECRRILENLEREETPSPRRLQVKERLRELEELLEGWPGAAVAAAESEPEAAGADGK